MNKKKTSLNKLDESIVNIILQSTYLSSALNLLADKLFNIGSPNSISLEDFNQLVGLVQICNSYANKHAKSVERTYQFVDCIKEKM